MQPQKLTKTDEFSSVFSFKKRFYGAWLIVNIMPNQRDVNRYGLVVPKRVAKRAVDRNYMKRVLRELVRREHAAQHGLDVILQVKTAFAHQQFHQVQEDLMHLMRKIQQRLRAIHHD